MSLPTPYYQRGPVTLYHGDCLELLPLISGVSAVVTSPPYNQLGSRMPAKPSGMHAETKWVSNTRDTSYFDDMEESEYQSWHNRVMGMCVASCNPGGSVFVNHKCRWRDTEIIHPVSWINIDGAKLRQEIIWRRAGSCTLNARMFAPNEERILWFVKRGAKWKWNQPSASFLSVWDIAQDRLANDHPCPYPEELPTRCIEAVTDVGDVVLEPFCGSGTTAVAAAKTGRLCVAIEKVEKFCEIAADRIDRELDQKRIEFEPAKRVETQRELFAEAATCR